MEIGLYVGNDGFQFGNIVGGKFFAAHLFAQAGFHITQEFGLDLARRIDGDGLGIFGQVGGYLHDGFHLAVFGVKFVLIVGRGHEGVVGR